MALLDACFSVGGWLASRGAFGDRIGLPCPDGVSGFFATILRGMFSAVLRGILVAISRRFACMFFLFGVGFPSSLAPVRGVLCNQGRCVCPTVQIRLRAVEVDECVDVDGFSAEEQAP